MGTPQKTGERHNLGRAWDKNPDEDRERVYGIKYYENERKPL